MKIDCEEQVLNSVRYVLNKCKVGFQNEKSYLLLRFCCDIEKSIGNISTLGSICEEAYAHLWTIHHSIPWKDISYHNLSLFSIVCLLLALARLHILDSSTTSLSPVIKVLDLGILMGSNSLSFEINAVIDEICSKSLGYQALKYPNNQQYTHLLPDILERSNPIISESYGLTLNEFYSRYLEPSIPIVIKDEMKDWPALSSSTRNWNDLSYIVQNYGNRIVPVELGNHYLSENSAQQLIPLRDFVSRFILFEENPTHEIGYLAQHRLFDQILGLRKDIHIPDYCCLLLPEDEESDNSDDPISDGVLINGWLGPCGTVSPVHHDPYHNLLCQVSGYKYVRIFPPSESLKLQPFVGKMSNNSQLDVSVIWKPWSGTSWSYVLGPGDMLFIPRWYWHGLLSVDKDTALRWKSMHAEESVLNETYSSPLQYSFSANFWWGKRKLKPLDED